MTWLKRNLVLVLTVVVPTIAAIIYYGFVASDVFISESRFLVRSPQHQTQGGMLYAICHTGVAICISADSL